MKHAWIGFAALVSGAVFLWLGADLICPASTALQSRPTDKGAAIQWDYHQLALEWRSSAAAASTKAIQISKIDDYNGATLATGSLQPKGTADYMLLLIPMTWVMTALLI